MSTDNLPDELRKVSSGIHKHSKAWQTVIASADEIERLRERVAHLEYWMNKASGLAVNICLDLEGALKDE